LIIGRHAHQPELHLVENDVYADFIDFVLSQNRKMGSGFPANMQNRKLARGFKSAVWPPPASRRKNR
jgi:hypothetical protein